jgi:hypothetical protein
MPISLILIFTILKSNNIIKNKITKKYSIVNPDFDINLGVIIGIIK